MRPGDVLTREAALGVAICSFVLATAGIVLILEPAHREEAWEKLRLLLDRQASSQTLSLTEVTCVTMFIETTGKFLMLSD